MRLPSARPYVHMISMSQQPACSSQLGAAARQSMGSQLANTEITRHARRHAEANVLEHSTLRTGVNLQHIHTSVSAPFSRRGLRCFGESAQYMHLMETRGHSRLFAFVFIFKPYTRTCAETLYATRGHVRRHVHTRVRSRSHLVPWTPARLQGQCPTNSPSLDSTPT